MNRNFLLLSILCVLITTPGTSWAHRIDVSAWVESGAIYTKSRFGNGNPVKNGTLFVLDSQKRQLLHGTLDSNGEFSFPIPQKSDLLIVVEASFGHRGEWKIQSDELDTGSATTQSDSDSPTEAPQILSSRTEKQIEALLDRKLKPVYAILAKLQNRGTTMTDIFGGTGYIIGLVGLAAYLRYRKNDA